MCTYVKPHMQISKNELLHKNCPQTLKKKTKTLPFADLEILSQEISLAQKRRPCESLQPLVTGLFSLASLLSAILATAQEGQRGTQR